jgi:DNA gyrase/topoisomerase IV subunit B
MVVKKAGQEARKEWLEKNPDNAQKVINHTIDW